jgi:16S rRNA (cytosine1402-N4)-methyltransferase
MAKVIVDKVDGVVMDIGVSSMQLDQAERGFSFQQDAPLDMRMDATTGLSAGDMVNSFDEETLADIFYYFGEERLSRRLAKAILQHRANAPIKTTLELAELVSACLKKPGYQKRHPATQIFQALRIAVNDELGELYRGLCAAEAILKPGGILSVVTFHSLEDRLVKRFFQLRSKGHLSANAGSSRYAHTMTSTPQDLTLALLTKRPVTPTDAEQDANPRALSAKLRSARKLDVESDNHLSVDDFDMPALTLAHRLKDWV